MATFGGPITYERIHPEQLKRVIKTEGMEIQLPSSSGSLWLVFPSQQGTLVAPDVSLLQGEGQGIQTVYSIEQAYQFFVQLASAISQVRYIAVHLEDGVIHVWTVIPSRDKETQRKIYNAELQLMERFPSFSYDFNILFCADADMRVALPSEAKIVYYSTENN